MIIKRYCTYILATIALANASLIYALDPNKEIHHYVHRTWTHQQGLKAHGIRAILQTKDGKLWLGTGAGLFIFDGVKFREIPTNPDKPESHESIASLYESKKGGLWIGTIFKGLRSLSENRIKSYGLKEGFEDTQVWDLYEDDEHKLYIATSIGLYGAIKGTFLKLFDRPNYISSVIKNRNGTLYLGTHRGVFILEGDKVVAKITTKDGLPSDVVTKLYFDKNKNLWIGTANGLAKFDGKKITVFNKQNGLSSNYIYAIFEDKDGVLWIGTSYGLNRYAQNRWTFFTEDDGLTNNIVYSITEDSEGSLWIGTSNGLNQLCDGNVTTLITKDGLAHNFISSVLTTTDNEIYFFHPEKPGITYFKGNTKHVITTSVGPCYRTLDGTIWMGQNGFIGQLKNGVLKTYTAKDGIPQRWISAITEDTVSLILYVDHTGLFRFKNKKLIPYTLKSGQVYPADEYVVCMYYQKNGTLWIGASNGIFRIQHDTMVWFTQKDGIVANWTSSITENSKGEVWFASPQGGITKYENGIFTCYSSKDGLSVDEVYSIVCDNDGNLWMGTLKGIQFLYYKEITSYDAKKIPKLNPRLFDISDGVKSTECFSYWQPACWKSDDGILWFSTKHGAIKIDPRCIKLNTIIPQVTVQQIVVNNVTIQTEGNVILPPSTNTLEFHYTAFSFIAPERVLFQYKLEGYDKEWSNSLNRRAAYYMNLPPAKYRFLVKACNNDGLWNNEPATIDFEIEPFYYQTIWFKVSAVVLVLGGILGLFYYRLYTHRKYEKELESKVQEALANIKVLSGLIPICSHCKKIRDDRGYWAQLEAYIQTHTEAKFTHGICPECVEKLYPENKINKKNNQSISDNEKE